MRIVIAEDHENVRRLVRAYLEEDDQVEVVGEAGDGLQAMDLARRLEPDVLVIDLRLPGLDGAEAARRMRSEYPSTRVIVMSMYDDDAHVYEALASGARGYVTKAQVDRLPQAIAAVASGGLYLAPPITLDRIEKYRQRTGKAPLDHNGGRDS